MGWMSFNWVIGAALIAAVVWALVRSSGNAGPRDRSPESILKRRYASGEIDRDTYQRMLADVRG
jgi:uncharacterized membrane protein